MTSHMQHFTASDGARPVVGSTVTSPTEKMPNCMAGGVVVTGILVSCGWN